MHGMLYRSGIGANVTISVCIDRLIGQVFEQIHTYYLSMYGMLYRSGTGANVTISVCMKCFIGQVLEQMVSHYTGYLNLCLLAVVLGHSNNISVV